MFSRLSSGKLINTSFLNKYLYLPDFVKSSYHLIFRNTNGLKFSTSTPNNSHVKQTSNDLKFFSKNILYTKNVYLFESFSKINNFLAPYVQLARLKAPIGTWLLFWPCAWSIGLASNPFIFWESCKYIGYCGLGAILMRSSGCIINDLWDKDFDSLVERTKNRPLVSGKIDIKRALSFLSLQLGLSLTILLQFPLFTVFIGLSSMSLVIIYPLMKRIFNWPQLVLGMAFNWGALLGWTAVSGAFNPPYIVPVMLYFSGICWTLVYDTIYAHQDKIDDLKIGIKSTAINWGNYNKHLLFAFSNFMSLGLSMAGIFNEMLWPYYTFVIINGIIQNWWVYKLDLANTSQCGHIFNSQSWIGLLIFLGIISSKYLTYSSDMTTNYSSKDSFNTDPR